MLKDTLEILKNFSGINQGIIFREGNKLRTMNVMKTVVATAILPDTFEREFAIYDLNEFLSTISLFQYPEISYKNDYVEISSNKNKVRYYYSSPSVVISIPLDKVIEFEPLVEFKITADVLEQMIKAAAVMKLKDLEISVNGIRAFNKVNGSSSSNQYKVEVEGIGIDANFDAKILKIENLKLLPVDYTVQVGERAVKFTSVSGDLEYIVAVVSDE